LADEVMVIERDAPVSMGLTGRLSPAGLPPLAVIMAGRQRPARA